MLGKALHIVPPQNKPHINASCILREYLLRLGLSNPFESIICTYVFYHSLDYLLIG